jgi:hypothetical protein
MKRHLQFPVMPFILHIENGAESQRLAEIARRGLNNGPAMRAEMSGYQGDHRLARAEFDRRF